MVLEAGLQKHAARSATWLFHFLLCLKLSELKELTNLCFLARPNSINTTVMCVWKVATPKFLAEKLTYPKQFVTAA